MNTKQPASTNIRVSRNAHYALHALAALRKEPMSETLLFLVEREIAAFERRVADKVNKAREERAARNVALMEGAEYAETMRETEAECHQ